MSAEKLVRMSNQIAAFFEPYPHEQAVAGVRDHLKSFWTPRMIEELRADIESGASARLDPLVVEAMAALKPDAAAA